MSPFDFVLGKWSPARCVSYCHWLKLRLVQACETWQLAFAIFSAGQHIAMLRLSLVCRVALCCTVPCCAMLQAFMVKLSKVIKRHPASLVNYRRMREPCARPQLKTQGDKQLSRTALFQQVQVSLG